MVSKNQGLLILKWPTAINQNGLDAALVLTIDDSSVLFSHLASRYDNQFSATSTDLLKDY